MKKSALTKKFIMKMFKEIHPDYMISKQARELLIVHGQSISPTDSDSINKLEKIIEKSMDHDDPNLKVHRIITIEDMMTSFKKFQVPVPRIESKEVNKTKDYKDIYSSMKSRKIQHKNYIYEKLFSKKEKYGFIGLFIREDDKSVLMIVIANLTDGKWIYNSKIVKI